MVSFTEAKRSVNFRQQLLDLGGFVYEEDGFTYQFRDGVEKIKWIAIERLEAYKVDLMTTDEIRVNIVYGEYQFTITEETPGWYQFVARTKEVFPTIPKDWDSVITNPAFATNFMVLYERVDRDKPKNTRV